MYVTYYIICIFALYVKPFNILYIFQIIDGIHLIMGYGVSSLVRQGRGTLTLSVAIQGLYSDVELLLFLKGPKRLTS